MKIVSHFVKEEHQSEVLLATALVNAKSLKGYSQITRALIDQGSEASFVTEATVQSLGLKRIPVNGLITGVGDGQTRSKNMVSLSLESLHNSEFKLQVNAFVLSTLTSLLPSSNTLISDWPYLENLPLADPKYGSPGRIDIILGVEVHSEIILQGLIKHPFKRGPVAQTTQFGWILSGRVENQTTSSNKRVISLHMQVKEDQLLKQFWEIEREPDCIEKKWNKEESRCEELFEATTERDKEGRYIVRLPFQNSDPDCIYGLSKVISLRRFKLLERKLLKNPSLYEEYKKVIDDYIKEGHMSLITNIESESNPKAVYLPHHAVVRDDKETTKLRVVFDASCKGVNNVSLNDNLLVGPKLQQDLRHILMRWRRHPFCIVADLVKMYRQVRVQDQDTEFQRILWRSDPNNPIQHYKLSRLTFGMACAPYLAVRTLQQLAKDEKSNYPIASKITLNDYYMDDMLSGCETEEEAIEIYEQMNKLMKAGGFQVQKWCSNSEKLLNFIKEENQKQDQSLVFKVNSMVKVLGISWNKNSDNFEYTLQLPEMSEPVTKRKVLSDIARLYDPIGWIAPIIIRAKIYIQRLWQSGLTWDENLTPELLREWLTFRDDLNNVKNIVIPRWLHSKKGDRVELHAFADASKAAYAAAVYMKTIDQRGHIHVHLVTAKTKVAPIEKEISIPRLELCGALLAAKLVFEVSHIMQVPKEHLYAWSDSTVVLAWLRGAPNRWTTFVSNRVSEIINMLDFDQWSHVGSKENPADCASRGIPISELTNHTLWWHGPEWLQTSNDYEIERDFSTKEEERAVKSLIAIIQTKEEFIWSKFSSLSKMLRVLSYCRKFLYLKTQNEQITRSKIVTTKEMQDILEICVKDTQNLYFCNEIKQLKFQGKVSIKGQLNTLCPMLNDKGILRVGGRIGQAQLDFDKKHPIILPSDSHLTKLLISDAHIQTLHGGPQNAEKRVSVELNFST